MAVGGAARRLSFNRTGEIIRQNSLRNLRPGVKLCLLRNLRSRQVMRGSICGAILVVAGLALPGSGQTPAAQTSPAVFGKPAPPARLPYMAEVKILRTQPVANGIITTHESTITTARDSLGRHMTATTEIPTSADQTATTHFHVFDPVAHVTFNWSIPGREATVMAIPFSGAISTGCGYMSLGIRYPNEKTTEEDLGTKTIQGVGARGRRITTTATVAAIGKHHRHKPQLRTIEVRSTDVWTAIDPGLTGLLVREVSQGLQSEKTSQELVNFSQSEPDAAFFQPPKGYAIVNREVNADPCVSLGEMQPPIASSPVLP